MKKMILGMMMVLGSVANASWWGELSGGTRAAIIGGSAIILNDSYQKSEIKHQKDLDRLDTEIRRNYEKEAVIENAHRKYGNSSVPPRLQNNAPNNYSVNNGQRQNKNLQGKVIYSDSRTQIIELSDGTRITLNQ